MSQLVGLEGEAKKGVDSEVTPSLHHTSHSTSKDETVNVSTKKCSNGTMNVSMKKSSNECVHEEMF